MRPKIKKYRIGDLVTVIQVPPDLGDDPESKTRTVFETCLGKTYAIQGFDQYGNLQLAVGKDVDHLVGSYMNTIWIEREFVMPTRKDKK